MLVVLHVYRWKRLDIPIIVALSGAYLVTNIIYWKQTGGWWYPFQERLGLAAIGVYPGMILLSIVYYFLGRVISYYYWSWLAFACCGKCVDPAPDGSEYDPILASSTSENSDSERGYR